MGPQPSTPMIQGTNRPFLNDYYMQVNQGRPQNTQYREGRLGVSVRKPEREIMSTPFNGVWSLTYPKSVAPEPRVGHAYAYHEETDSLIIAYGSRSNGSYFNDAWMLDLQSNRWRPLSYNLLSPRTAARCVLQGDKLWVFGGIFETTMINELHTISIDDGAVEVIKTNGTPPSPRTSPAMGITSTSLVVWGGFDGQTPSNLHILDLKTLTWREIPTNLVGRAAAAFCQVDTTLWIFGSARTHALFKMDLNTFNMQAFERNGTEPAPVTQNSAIVHFDRYLLTFGGSGEDQYTYVYAFDMIRQWWFVFHVAPDGDTVTHADGEVIDIGLFMLPREHSYSACYRKKHRQVISTLGSNELDPPPVYRISIGNALAILHMRNDMIEMLSFN